MDDYWKGLENGCLFSFLFALVLAVALSLTVQFKWVSQDTLVESGHAEYYLDANNQRQWRMKECE